MKAIRNLVLACAVVMIGAARAGAVGEGQAGHAQRPGAVAALAAAGRGQEHGIEIEMVMFQRFADARTALASGDIEITAFGPQDISLGLGAGRPRRWSAWRASAPATTA